MLEVRCAKGKSKCFIHRFLLHAEFENIVFHSTVGYMLMSPFPKPTNLLREDLFGFSPVAIPYFSSSGLKETYQLFSGPVSDFNECM